MDPITAETLRQEAAYPQDVRQLAVAIIRDHAEMWPEDDWFNLGDDHDLNLYDDEVDGTWYRRAVIYPVVDGCTVTDDCFHIDVANVLASR